MHPSNEYTVQTSDSKQANKRYGTSSMAMGGMVKIQRINNKVGSNACVRFGSLAIKYFQQLSSISNINYSSQQLYYLVGSSF